MKAIIAISEGGVIGNGDSLPWPKIPGDLKFFKKETLGKKVIMGKKTYDGILKTGQTLPGRKVFVATHNPELFNFSNKNRDHFFFDPRFCLIDPTDDAIIAGGKSIYEFYMPLIKEVLITMVKGKFEGNVLAPDFGVLDLAEVIEETDKYNIYRFLK